MYRYKCNMFSPGHSVITSYDVVPSSLLKIISRVFPLFIYHQFIYSYPSATCYLHILRLILLGYINRCDHSNSLNDKKLSFSKEAPPPEHYESATQVSSSLTYIHRLLGSSAGNTVQRMWKLIVGGINFTPLLMIKDRISEKRMTYGHQYESIQAVSSPPLAFSWTTTSESNVPSYL